MSPPRPSPRGEARRVEPIEVEPSEVKPTETQPAEVRPVEDHAERGKAHRGQPSETRPSERLRSAPRPDLGSWRWSAGGLPDRRARPRSGAPRRQPDEGGAVAALEDLKRIRGIGLLIEKELNRLGVASYEHIANWTAADIDRVSRVLDFKGRIERENWVEQARILASGGRPSSPAGSIAARSRPAAPRADFDPSPGSEPGRGAGGEAIRVPR